MATLKKAAKIIVTKCLGLKKNESCLIITDKNKFSIGKVLFFEALKISKKVELIEIPVGKVNAEEPPSEVTKKMRKYDVIICPTTKSLTHTDAVILARKKGARVATLPNINEDILKRCIDVDYDEMKTLTNKLADILDKAKKVHITTKIGTDIAINLSGMKATDRNSGLIAKKGELTNLPEGETYIAPKQIGTNGIYIVDASQAGVGKLGNPIKITVKDGFAVKIEGKKEAKNFQKLLLSIKDKNAYNVAELGIGTNKKAKITGIILEDEKVFGTCHIALGKNDSFGGSVNVPIHVDGVIQKPTIIADGKIIMEEGKLLI
jgi:aminopeptidase